MHKSKMQFGFVNVLCSYSRHTTRSGYHLPPLKSEVFDDHGCNFRISHWKDNSELTIIVLYSSY